MLFLVGQFRNYVHKLWTCWIFKWPIVICWDKTRPLRCSSQTLRFKYFRPSLEIVPSFYALIAHVFSQTIPSIRCISVWHHTWKREECKDLATNGSGKVQTATNVQIKPYFFRQKGLITLITLQVLLTFRSLMHPMVFTRIFRESTKLQTEASSHKAVY